MCLYFEPCKVRSRGQAVEGKAIPEEHRNLLPQQRGQCRRPAPTAALLRIADGPLRRRDPTHSNFQSTRRCCKMYEGRGTGNSLWCQLWVASKSPCSNGRVATWWSFASCPHMAHLAGWRTFQQVLVAVKLLWEQEWARWMGVGSCDRRRRCNWP